MDRHLPILKKTRHIARDASMDTDARVKKVLSKALIIDDSLVVDSVLLAEDLGITVRRQNHKRTYRIYRELGLQLRAKTPKRRVRAKLREDRCPAERPNQTWAMDFVHDQLALGKKIRVLTVVDIFSKFSPVIDPRFSYRGGGRGGDAGAGLR